jgi:predicted metal-dependent hydrolase
MSKIKLLSLTPDYDEDNHRVYLDAIEDALTEGDSIKNIALTGGHGVGKSSVLAKLAEAHGNDVVQISLSTLGLSDGDGGGEKSTTNRIQKEIVKQLLYREEPHRMPGSRFRRIARLKFLRSLGTAVLGGFALSLVFFLAGWTTKLEQLFSATALGLWFQFWVFLVLSVTAFGVLVLFHNRIAIKGFKVASADITLTSEETTYFDQFLDEIVYFFDVTKCHIVIFEDIDRFDDPHIFETLRALNTLLNASKQLDGRKIRFVYAIKDSIFEVLGEPAAVESGEEATPDVYAEDRGRDEVARANRTKFFDLVIPVVPFITHRNARDLVARVMNDVEPKISGELIELAARHLPEMRLIKNVHNEFLIFRKKVLGAKDGDLNLSPDELFAMMLYKNTSLSDFELVKSGQSKREMVTGESHYVDGMRYRLKVVERPGRAHIELDKSRLAMYVPVGTTAERKREILDRWYRERLRATVPDLIIKWEPVMGITIPCWTIRKMKTKWGSCNRKTGHLWFNVELAKHPQQCLEYIVVHEMAHHLEPDHRERYAVLMDKFLPDWRSRRDLLNQVPLAEAEWSGHRTKTAVLAKAFSGELTLASDIHG